MIFIDTGPFLARYLSRDQHHETALRAWAELAGGNLRCFTSNFVLDEAFTLLARRASYPFAVERARSILASTSLTVLRPSPEVEAESVEFFEKLADQRVSFTDCVSFALMRRTGIETAFTFDRHFHAARFGVWPGQA